MLKHVFVVFQELENRPCVLFLVVETKALRNIIESTGSPNWILSGDGAKIVGINQLI